MDETMERVRSIMIGINRIDGLYYLSAKRTGLKENTLALLYALNDGKRHTQTQISEQWLIPKTTINTVVKECVEQGYVSFEPGEHRREKTLFLTPAGKAYADALLSDLYQMECTALKKTLERYPADWIDALSEFAAQLTAAFGGKEERR